MEGALYMSEGGHGHVVAYMPSLTCHGERERENAAQLNSATLHCTG